jgi:putative ABC transport system ATP-binding protein
MQKSEHMQGGNGARKKIVELVGVSKHFMENGVKLQILDEVSLEVYEGERIAIVGPSGSGKSTILSLVAGLDTPSSGAVFVNGRDVARMAEPDLARYRAADVGIIFQSFELIVPFTVWENVTAPQDIQGVRNDAHAETLLAAVSMTHKKHSPVMNLSGGEKQRVAIARSLANKPSVVLADEPTGSLDRVTGAQVLDLLVSLTVEGDAAQKRTLIVITHDVEISAMMDRVYVLRDKKLHLQV